MIEVFIGVETHIQLKTERKLFCRCSSNMDSKPNSNICPVCIALPGTLPKLNIEALKYAIKGGVVLNCEIADRLLFVRKNYFYPDLPSGYQMTQKDFPIGKNGYLTIDYRGEKIDIKVDKVELENDSAKMIHIKDTTKIDYNRSGIPLIEIVTPPVLKDSDMVLIFLKKLKHLISYIGISDTNMEMGGIRVDINISLKDGNNRTKRVEIKNLNSFKSIKKAIEFEIERGRYNLNNSKDNRLETRSFDPIKEITKPMRLKNDNYRFFIEPDLPPFLIDKNFVERLKKEIPTLPDKKIKEFIEIYDIPKKTAKILTSSYSLSKFFEQTVQNCLSPKKAANWIVNIVLSILKKDNITIEQLSLTPNHITSLINNIENGTISTKQAKKVFDEMLITYKMPFQIVQELNLSQLIDSDKIKNLIKILIDENYEEIKKFKEGKIELINFFIGRLLILSNNKINPEVAKRLLNKYLINGEGIL